MAKLIDYYGEECVICKKIEPLLNKLKKEEGVIIQRIEVWHNAGNQKKMMNHAKGRCQALPFIYNPDTDEFLCGNAADNYAALKKLAKDKK